MPDPRDFLNEFDKALAELRQLCDENIPSDVRKDRIAIRREMNRLLGLYTILQKDAAEDRLTTEEADTLTEIRGHLEPLGLAPEGTPLPELARLAALRITDK